MKKSILFTLVFLFLLSSFSFAQDELKMISGMVRGSYYRFASDIKRVSTIPLDISPSGGSLENFNKLSSTTEPLIAFIQYDVLIYKKYKDRENKTNLTNNIRVLTPLAGEEIHLICRKDDNINNLVDLKNKRVAVGSKNQGTFITASLIKGLRQIDWIDVPIGFDKAFPELLAGTVDAIFYVGYAPATKLYRFTAHEKIKLVPLKYRKLKTIYSPAFIPAGTYKWADYDVETYAVKSVLVTNANNESDQIKMQYIQLLQDIKKNIDVLKKEGHTKWKDVNFDFQEVKWPIYPGAIKAVYPY